MLQLAHRAIPARQAVVAQIARALFLATLAPQVHRGITATQVQAAAQAVASSAAVAKPKLCTTAIALARARLAVFWMETADKPMGKA